MDQEEVGRIVVTGVAKPLLEILAGGDKTVDLEAEDYNRYIHIRLDNIIKKFEGETMIRTDNYYPITRCREEFF